MSNEPLVLVKSLEAGNETYESAKTLLQQAFASRLSQQYEAIRRLSEMKLLAGGDPYKYVDDMRLLTESFNSLQVDANLVLQYFFWSGINTDMKREITHIANKNRPSLDEINANIFYAFVRYLASTKSKVKKLISLSMQMTIFRLHITLLQYPL